MKAKNEIPGTRDQGRGLMQGNAKSNRSFTDVKTLKKVQGTPNGGGQMHFQTDNKQSTTNRGNQSPETAGKKRGK